VDLVAVLERVGGLEPLPSHVRSVLAAQVLQLRITANHSDTSVVTGNPCVIEANLRIGAAAEHIPAFMQRELLLPPDEPACKPNSPADCE
jgi:hypothetical protein